MIADHIDHASCYYALGTGIETALRYLASEDMSKREPGRYDLPGGCFALVQDYESAPREEKRWEAHRKYIDVQFVASGVELIGCGCTNQLQVAEEYDDAKDVTWFEGEGSYIEARAGTFLILYPHDAHMPGVAAGEPQPVRKVVVKVPVER